LFMFMAMTCSYDTTHILVDETKFVFFLDFLVVKLQILSFMLTGSLSLCNEYGIWITR
jgi:hypothetical protein